MGGGEVGVGEEGGEFGAEGEVGGGDVQEGDVQGGGGEGAEVGVEEGGGEGVEVWRRVLAGVAVTGSETRVGGVRVGLRGFWGFQGKGEGEHEPADSLPITKVRVGLGFGCRAAWRQDLAWARKARRELRGKGMIRDGN